MASCSSSGCRELTRLEKLQCGVVRTFRPTDGELVGHYLYGEMKKVHGGNGKQAFPEMEVYGKTGMEPWSIWESLEPIRIPHQEFSYFFARLKSLSKNGKGKRCSRTVGSDGTWSETEPFKTVYVNGFQEPFGRMRKFRYENTKSDHHGAWMMEEFSIQHSDVVSSNLVLCRMKRNENGSNKRKRRSTNDEEVNAKRTKSFQEEKQVISHSHHEQQQPQLSDFHPQKLLSVRELFGDNVAHQAGLEEGSTSAQQQQIPTPNFDNNKNITADDVIVSQNESEHADLEDDISWLDDIAWDEDVGTSFSDSQLKEEGTDHNGSASEGTRVETLLPALLEEQISSPLMLQQQEDLSSSDDEAFAFACDNEFIPMDGASCFQFDNNSDFYFHFEHQHVSEEATLPHFPVSH